MSGLFFRQKSPVSFRHRLYMKFCVFPCFYIYTVKILLPQLLVKYSHLINYKFNIFSVVGVLSKKSLLFSQHYFCGLQNRRNHKCNDWQAKIFNKETQRPSSV